MNGSVQVTAVPAPVAITTVTPGNATLSRELLVLLAIALAAAIAIRSR